MTLEQIKDEIWSLKSNERIELYRWLDYYMTWQLISIRG